MNSSRSRSSHGHSYFEKGLYLARCFDPFPRAWLEAAAALLAKTVMAI
jgi:hypothetical protein